MKLIRKGVALTHAKPGDKVIVKLDLDENNGFIER